ncbi:unnamed protein product [Kuraishia capsulata CBS 1993]|uniref:Protein kinase domain-containing protein n=1 Tax=Kuraishia capsulata CBS 1993 TaxID=1382522 RepID=W6MGI4_9ASCO|nr:uncharacterized protein KUCA_T00000594001 [Kuraishia capsulata CBS 1993]CDK24628.1 unnamed protein product [Kuraishia capsulata CBS 1993]
MFGNFKQFIRHGKQANLYQDPGATPEASLATPEEGQRHDKKDQYSKMATDIVREENEERKRKQQYANLDRYALMEKLGEGAFSVVHKARDLQTGELVAVKVIKKFQLDEKQQAAVLKEVTILRQMDHPNIVKFLNFIECDEHYYIVQELVSGGEIFAEIVKFTYLSEDLSRHIIIQVARAIRYLHEEVGVVHRDIKPENMLFEPIDLVPSKHGAKLRASDDPNTKLDEGQMQYGVGGGGIGVVKLADFGLSKQIWESNTKTPCGTVGYTAPEIVRDERYSKEVDMWAIGCVLYTLLCGFPPFYDERIETLTEKVARAQYTFLSPWWDEISIGAKKCVRNLLTLDPRKRYTIDDFLNDPWILEFDAKYAASAAPAAPVVPMAAPATTVVNHQPVAATMSVPHPVETIQRFSSHLGSDGSEFQPPAYTSNRVSPALYSPAALALRDAFDISAAVHRMGEEAALPGNSAAYKRGGKLDMLSEEDSFDEEREVEHFEGALRQPRPLEVETDSGRVTQQEGVMSPVRLASKPFDLNLKTATILERRKNKAPPLVF